MWLAGQNIVNIAESGVFYGHCPGGPSIYIGLSSGSVITGNGALNNAGPISADFDGIFMFGDQNRINNSGTIRAADTAVICYAFNGAITNSGKITSLTGDALNVSANEGVQTKIINTSTINGAFYAVFSGTGNPSSAIVSGLLGNDLMRGDLGIDVFVFSSVGHAGKTNATADRIPDFTRTADLIDLSASDARQTSTTANDAFAFIGTAVFSNVAGQLRYLIDVPTTTTYVQMDVNGDSVADSIIRLTGQIALQAGDFIL